MDDFYKFLLTIVLGSFPTKAILDNSKELGFSKHPLLGVIFIFSMFGLIYWIIDKITGSPKEKVEYPDNWNELRRAALERDGYECSNCSDYGKVHVHHIVPLSKGGTNNLKNLITLCEGCHKKLHPHMK